MTELTLSPRAADFDTSFDTRFSSNPSTSGLDLAVEIYEERGNIIAKMALPRMHPDNLDIFVDEDTLRISGARLEEKETKDKGYINKEVRRESFSRGIDLPMTVDASRAFAQYRNDILYVTMPVAPRRKEKATKVKIEA